MRPQTEQNSFKRRLKKSDPEPQPTSTSKPQAVAYATTAAPDTAFFDLAAKHKSSWQQRERRFLPTGLNDKKSDLRTARLSPPPTVPRPSVCAHSAMHSHQRGHSFNHFHTEFRTAKLGATSTQRQQSTCFTPARHPRPTHREYASHTPAWATRADHGNSRDSEARVKPRLTKITLLSSACARRARARHTAPHIDPPPVQAQLRDAWPPMG